MTGFDVLVVGSGFGGSVAALRAAEKGYRVGVLEAGQRFGPEDFPRTNWHLRRYLWLPRLGCRGIVAELDAAGLAPAAGMHLRLDHDLAAELRRDRLRLRGRVGDDRMFPRPSLRTG